MSRGGQQFRMNIAADKAVREGPERNLEHFRSEWWRRFQFGLARGELSLPPMDSDLARQAHADASAHYYRPCGHADLKVSKALREETHIAIDAAHAHFRSINGKPHKLPELHRALRDRDGNDCWVCGHELHEHTTIEHKVARANGGTWAFANLALAHAECNHSLARLPVEAKEAARQAIQGRKSQ